MRSRLRPFLLLIAAPIAVPLAGQQPVRAPRDSSALAPVVITETRVSVPRVSATASVTVLDGADLRARGITSVTEALRLVPGAAIVQQGSVGGITSLFLRGGNSNYTKVLIDGVAVNSPGGAMDFSFLTTDNVDRIEVVRGPASVLYGSDAVAGVIQIFTRRGSAGARLDASARGGTFGTREGELSVSGGSARAGYSLGGGYHATDGIYPLNNDFRNGVASGTLHGRAGAGDAQLSMRVSDGRFHYPTGGSGLSANLDSNSVRDDRRAVVGLDGGWRFSPRLEARVLVADNETRTRSDNQPDSPGDTSGFYGTSRSSIYRRSADLRLNLFAARGHVVTLGGELSQQHESSRDTSRFQRFPQSVTTFTQTRRNTAAFAQWIGNVGERASFTASGRLDANERFGDFATYRAGAAYRFASGTRVRGAAGTAFKEPLFSETFNTSFSKGDSTLSPERTRSWEAGVEQSVASGRVLLSATWFDQRFRDLIQYKYSPATSPAPNYFNVGAAKSSGLELEARLPSLRTLSVGASYTYLTTAVTDSGFGNFGTFAKGDRLLRRPQQSANLALGWTPVQRTTFGATINRVGSRPDRDFGASKKVDLPAYTKVDLSADVSLPVPARAVALTLRVDNATNAAYQAVFGFPAPGRAVLVGARVGVGK